MRRRAGIKTDLYLSVDHQFGSDLDDLGLGPKGHAVVLQQRHVPLGHIITPLDLHQHLGAALFQHEVDRLGRPNLERAVVVGGGPIHTDGGAGWPRPVLHRHRGALLQGIQQRVGGLGTAAKLDAVAGHELTWIGDWFVTLPE